LFCPALKEEEKKKKTHTNLFSPPVPYSTAAMSSAPKIATFTTSMGTFKAELYADQMPITCGNFIDLASE